MKSATEMAKALSNPVAKWLALNSDIIEVNLLRNDGKARFRPNEPPALLSPVLTFNQVHELVQVFRDLGYDVELTDNPNVKMEIKVTVPRG